MADGDPTGPLQGINVLDFTAYQNGPMSTRLLADYGATVIKATRALLLERLDTLRAAAYKALPRPADPLTTLPNGTL